MSRLRNPMMESSSPITPEPRKAMTLDEFIRRTGHSVLYHFTDISNLPLIKEHGLLSIRELRKRGIRPPRPASDSDSRKKDTELGLDRYVRLCLKNDHQMKHVAMKEGRIVCVKFLMISMRVLQADGILGCQCVAYKDNGKFILPLEDALDKLDLEVLFDIPSPELEDEETKNRFYAAKKSEILVPDHIPTSLILNLHD
jgi:hypothetical protein